MSTAYAVSPTATTGCGQVQHALAESITRAASTQTFYTVRFLADVDRMQDAYKSYAYFRWVDDTLDQDGLDQPGRAAFVRRQQSLVDRCYRGDWPQRLADEEWLLADLVRSDTEPDSGLQSYIRHMMAVMAFDAGRRGKLVSAFELERYTHWLAVAVTEAMFHFVGHGRKSPGGEARYAAVTAAHITHMLRDTVEDAALGYFNIPRETVDANGIDLYDVTGAPYQAWVRGRAQLARNLFEQGREYLSRVDNPRYCLAVYAYIARFECVLDSIERENYLLRAAYPERKSPCAALRMGWSVLGQAIAQYHPRPLRRVLSAR